MERMRDGAKEGTMVNPIIVERMVGSAVAISHDGGLDKTSARLAVEHVVSRYEDIPRINDIITEYLDLYYEDVLLTVDRSIVE